MSLFQRKSFLRLTSISSIILLLFFSKLSTSQDLTAYLYLAQFKTTEKSTYVETYLNIIGNTVAFKKNKDGLFQSEIEILYLFKQDNKIKAFEKHILKSPTVQDSVASLPNYIDVQRIAVANGIYNFEIRIIDLNDTLNKFSYKDIVNISMGEEFQFSDIELVKSYKKTEETNVLSKNGTDIVPYVSSFYTDNMDTITFYTELYNEGRIDDYLLQYHIEKQNKEEILNKFIAYKKIKAKKLTPIIKSFNIKDLPTGNYNLVLTIKNKENKIVCNKKFFFQRYNSRILQEQDTVHLDSYGLAELQGLTNIALLKDYIKSTIPVLNQRELFKTNNILKSDDIVLLKNYFNNYWKSVSRNPEQDWEIYKQKVNRVNMLYSSQIKRGYESDRGIVFLKYGKPNNIDYSNHEPSSYPYEIWHYFVVNEETNKRFIFYNPEIAGEDYTLLHSDVTGEKYNPYWQKDLTRRNSNKPNNFDSFSNDPQYGNRSQDLYRR